MSFDFVFLHCIPFPPEEGDRIQALILEKVNIALLEDGHLSQGLSAEKSVATVFMP